MKVKERVRRKTVAGVKALRREFLSLIKPVCVSMCVCVSVSVFISLLSLQWQDWSCRAKIWPPTCLKGGNVRSHRHRGTDAGVIMGNNFLPNKPCFALLIRNTHMSTALCMFYALFSPAVL